MYAYISCCIVAASPLTSPSLWPCTPFVVVIPISDIYHHHLHSIGRMVSKMRSVLAMPCSLLY